MLWVSSWAHRTSCLTPFPPSRSIVKYDWCGWHFWEHNVDKQRRRRWHLWRPLHHAGTLNLGRLDTEIDSLSLTFICMIRKVYLQNDIVKTTEVSQPHNSASPSVKIRCLSLHPMSHLHNNQFNIRRWFFIAHLGRAGVTSTLTNESAIRVGRVLGR